MRENGFSPFHHGLTFITEGWQLQSTQAKLRNRKSPGEGAGLDIFPFSWLWNKRFAPCVAEGLFSRADVARRRAYCEDISKMQPDHSDERSEIEISQPTQLPALFAGCAGVCSECAPRGVHISWFRNRRNTGSIPRKREGGIQCAGCAGSKRYYRVAGARTRSHTPVKKVFGWTPHTLHTHLSGDGNSSFSPSITFFCTQRRAPPGVHTGPQGGAHLGRLNLRQGGIHA